MASHKNLKRIWPVRQDEQPAIVRRVEALFALADQIKARLTAAQRPVMRGGKAKARRVFGNSFSAWIQELNQCVAA